MRLAKGRIITGALVCGVMAASTVAVAAASDGTDDPSTWTAVPAAAKVTGTTVPNAISPELDQHVVAQGSMKLDGGTAELPYYGYDGDGPLLPAPGALPAAGTKIEASKTEPDKNTYLRLRKQTGPDASYSYGTHFLFQGHETGTQGYLTRINLDADAAHRVTLMASTYADGTKLPTWDGSTWDPFAQRLLLTAEGGLQGGVSQATASYPSKVDDLAPILGRGGFEGIQNDAAGNIYIVEDAGGTTIPGTNAKVPNSFVFKFVPVDPADLTKGGKLQALQVTSLQTQTPITFQAVDAAHPQGNAFSADQKDISSYGKKFATQWVTVHDTAVDTSGTAFNANAAAKTAGATPFKRPENGVFRPGSKFREFYFTVTGDTNATATANTDFGGWGSVYKLKLSSSGRGQLSLVYTGDQAHAGFDNVTFLDDHDLAVVEDAGDTLHAQRAALDSGYVVDVTHDYSSGDAPSRFLAEGRDPSATLDSAFSALGNFNNEGDNEITGIHASNGDASTDGVLGAQVPSLFQHGWRLFWTAQHGDNATYEVTPR